MEELLKSIKQTEKELELAKAKRQKAEVGQFAVLDKNILRLELSLKRLKESQYLQERQEKGETPTDTFTQAKVFAAEIVSQVSEQGGDMNTDPRMIAVMRLTDTIDRLEMLKMAPETTCSTAFPDNSDFTAPFESYIEAKSDRIEKARKEIQEMELEIERIKAALSDAMKAGNGKEIIEYSESLETARKHREYLLPMLQEQEQSETIPQGAIMQAWKETCDLYRHEFALRLEVIRTAQEIHKRACSELIEFDNLLKQARYSLQNFAKENGSPDQIVQYNQQITGDLDMSWLRNRQTNDNEKVYTKVHFNRAQSL